MDQVGHLLQARANLEIGVIGGAHVQIDFNSRPLDPEIGNSAFLREGIKISHAENRSFFENLYDFR